MHIDTGKVKGVQWRRSLEIPIEPMPTLATEGN